MVSSKSSSSRHARRAARKATEGTSEAAIAAGADDTKIVKFGCFDAKAVEEDSVQNIVAATDAPAPLPVGRTKPMETSILGRLPTPARSIPRRAAAKAATEGASALVVATATAARGPEPWAPCSDSATSQGSVRGAYRESLQNRGHQAMQRSLVPGAQAPTGPAPFGSFINSSAPPSPAILSAVPAGLVCSPPSSLPSPSIAPAVSMSAVPDDIQRWLCMPLDMQSAQPSACGMPAIGIPEDVCIPPMLPMDMVGNCIYPMIPDNCVVPSAYVHGDGSGQPMLDGTILAQPFHGAGTWIQGELMQTLMPEDISSMDKEQLAEQLRAASDCQYED